MTMSRNLFILTLLFITMVVAEKNIVGGYLNHRDLKMDEKLE